MGEDTQRNTMSEGRGLLTEEERKAIAGDKSDSYRWKTRSFFRNRIEKVAIDVETLKNNDEELLEELRDVVCE